MNEKDERKIYPYEEGIMERKELVNLRTYEYNFPFNYENIQVNRIYDQGETLGMELNPINSYWPDTVRRPPDSVTISEDSPIVKVVVIGSACTPPGYVLIECEPLDDFRRNDEMIGVMPVRFRQNNLWGMHLRGDQWITPTPGVKSSNNKEYDSIPEEMIRKLPGLKGLHMKADYSEFPLTGMSCAVFEVPMSKKVSITGGCELPGSLSDNYADDCHYSFRIFRITVADKGK